MTTKKSDRQWPLFSYAYLLFRRTDLFRFFHSGQTPRVHIVDIGVNADGGGDKRVRAQTAYIADEVLLDRTADRHEVNEVCLCRIDAVLLRIRLE